VKMAEMRLAIIKLHEKGYSTREIEQLLDVSKSSVGRHIKRYDETGNHEDRKGRGRKKTARSRKNIERAKGMIQRNSTSKVNSGRKLGKKLGMSDRSSRRILHEDLGLKAFKFQKRQKLTEEANKKRLDKCRAMLKRFSN
uniref:Uncharacterized protein n=1 Tax=Acrobeloides nanus TaxID=290746 RepID=A0A914EJC5_9BILA